MLVFQFTRHVTLGKPPTISGPHVKRDNHAVLSHSGTRWHAFGLIFNVLFNCKATLDATIIIPILQNQIQTIYCSSLKNIILTEAILAMQPRRNACTAPCGYRYHIQSLQTTYR